MNYAAEHGPDFRAFDARPFFFGSARRCSRCRARTGFAGFAGATLGPRAARAPRSRLPQRLRAVGILARLGVTNRIMLSPEGSTLDEMKAVTRALLADGLRTFTFSFHSPSVEPGHTPYVRSPADLGSFCSRSNSSSNSSSASWAARTTTPLASGQR